MLCHNEDKPKVDRFWFSLSPNSKQTPKFQIERFFPLSNKYKQTNKFEFIWTLQISIAFLHNCLLHLISFNEIIDRLHCSWYSRFIQRGKIIIATVFGLFALIRITNECQMNTNIRIIQIFRIVDIWIGSLIVLFGLANTFFLMTEIRKLKAEHSRRF